MKKSLFLFISIILINCLISCGDDKSKIEESSVKTSSESNQSSNDNNSNENSVTEITENKIELPVDDFKPIESFSKEDLTGKEIYPVNREIGSVDEEQFIINGVDKVYIIGFSKDGKIAYSVNHFMDGAGCDMNIFYIQDLVSDLILEKVYAVESSEYIQSENELYYAEGNEYPVILELLNRYKINPGEFEMEKFPGKINGNTFDGSIKTVDTGKLEFDFIPVVDYSCNITKNGTSAKTIVERKDSSCSKALLCGYVKCPYEERIAVVIGEVCYGFEGFYISFYFSGCDLNKGFKITN